MALATPLLFTFSASRLISYASPAIPWVAALVAAGAPAPGVADGAPTRRYRWHLGLSTAATALAVLALALVPWLVPGAERTAWTTGAAIAAAIVAAAALAIRRAPAPALVAVALVVGLAATATAYRERLGAHRPIVEALASRRAAGEAVGVAIHKDGDWGLVPFYLGETVRFFGYEARLSTRPPEADAPEGFRPIEEVRAWWDVPERRWLLVRARVTNPHNDVRRRLVGTRVVEVARYGRYALITNQE
jgi:hypothetical protein